MTEKFHTSTTFHPLSADGIVLPPLFNNPFHYKPHPLCILAAEEVKRHIAANKALSAEAYKGKMFGVLVGKNHNGTIGFFAAFSGILGERTIYLISSHQYSTYKTLKDISPKRKRTSRRFQTQ